MLNIGIFFCVLVCGYFMNIVNYVYLVFYIYIKIILSKFINIFIYYIDFFLEMDLVLFYFKFEKYIFLLYIINIFMFFGIKKMMILKI